MVGGPGQVVAYPKRFPGIAERSPSTIAAHDPWTRGAPDADVAPPAPNPGRVDGHAKVARWRELMSERIMSSSSDRREHERCPVYC